MAALFFLVYIKDGGDDERGSIQFNFTEAHTHCMTWSII